ncbi:c-type cytochrome [Geothrix fuzhouensis]|uniref:c-type cytochrome n=1 Tax=Geothrix fuzhouensis TaxID=2966451 RepID=UPI002149993C|nr:cytochrome c [Geothrix fuzhouensis]
MGTRSVALLLVILPASLSAQVRDLREFYRERCVACHGAEGTGRGPNGARLGGGSLLDLRRMARQEEAGLVITILRGRGAMPGFGRQLTEPEARRLVTEVLRPMASHKKR